MSTNSKLLSPDSSPDVAAISACVRRVNNLPIVIFGAIMLILMLLMMLVVMAEQIEAARQEGLPDDVVREREALDDQDLKAFAREDRGRDGARWARTDDEHVHTVGKRKHRG